MRTTVDSWPLILIPSPREAAFTGALIDKAGIDDALFESLSTRLERPLPATFTETPLAAGAYTLDISADGVEVGFGDDEGRRNAVATLAEMARQLSGLPEGRVRDKPGFRVRAVIEGYCGKPWPREGRLKTLEFMARRKFNLFFSSTRTPKASFNWRDPLERADLDEIAETFEAARSLGIGYVWSIRPADIIVSDEADRSRLLSKLRAVFGLGVRRFMLLEDDVSRPQGEPDKAAYGDYGAAHTALTREVYDFLKGLDADCRLVFCPTPYATAWTNRPDRRAYLAKVADTLPEDIDVIWTGPYCCSAQVTAANARYFGSLVGRRPFLWDNYPVVDGRPGVIFLGPLRRREAALAQASNGYGTNLMDWPVLNFPPVSTIAEFLWNPHGYDGDASIDEALELELGRRALPVASRIAQIYSAVWTPPETSDERFGSARYYLAHKGEAAAAERIENVSRELESLLAELAELTDNRAFVEALRPAVANLAVLRRPVRLDADIEAARARGDRESVEKLEARRAQMLAQMERGELRFENLAAISYLRGDSRYFRQLVGDTSTVI